MPSSEASHLNDFFNARALGVAAIVACVGFLIIHKFSSDVTNNVAAIYNGAFTFLSIFLGFLTTFYVFVASKSNRFLEKIRKLSSYTRLLRLMKSTIAWSGLTVVQTYLFTILVPTAFETRSFTAVCVFFWAFSIILTAYSFMRCAKIFVKIVEIQDGQED